MSQVLSGLEFSFAYLDEILIDITVWKEHLQYFGSVFNHLQVC